MPTKPMIPRVQTMLSTTVSRGSTTPAAVWKLVMSVRRIIAAAPGSKSTKSSKRCSSAERFSIGAPDSA
ncbi:MAG: hypothetical protein BWY85_01307 [Firmicutes bacterium ADurb.Bin506]|nr:MAG: hypothetical protein BWY85_01307 [Firmicutes bacterium ADurb.Bin506]